MNKDQLTEWKASWHDEYLKWVCGFANADGGLLVIGREELRRNRVFGWNQAISGSSSRSRQLISPAFLRRNAGKDDPENFGKNFGKNPGNDSAGHKCHDSGNGRSDRKKHSRD